MTKSIFELNKRMMPHQLHVSLMSSVSLSFRGSSNKEQTVLTDAVAFFIFKEKDITTSQSFATVFFSFIGKEIPINPYRISGRIIVLCTSMTGALLVWSYSACLVSFLTVDTIIFPISNVKVRHLIFKYWH